MTEFVVAENLEINSEHDLVVVYLAGISLVNLWQLVLNFEMKKTVLGYGIAEDKLRSRNKALKRLNEIEQAL